MPTQHITWDESEVVQSRADALLAEQTAKNDKEALIMAWADTDAMQWAYEDFKDSFFAILQAISPEGKFLVEGRNLGWRQTSGHAFLQAKNAEDFIERVFPKTSEWTLRGCFEQQKRVFTFTLYHHDAPTGEYYRVTRSKNCEQ